MLYRLLGMAVWKVGKLFVRRKLGRATVPRGVLVGAAVALVAALVVGGVKARSAGSSQLTP